MTAYQLIFATVALSLPVVTLIAVGRNSLCFYRSLNTKYLKLTLLSLLGTAGLLGVFSVAVVLWFGYAVTHSQKDEWTDLTLLAITGIPIYAGAYGLWRLAVHIESRMEKDDA